MRSISVVGKRRATSPPFWFLLTALTLVASGQSIRVHTEMQRIDPFGNVIKADRSADGRSREVLSPALGRHTFSSFHVVVEPPVGVPYWLYIGTNPETILDVTLYKEIFELRDGEWVPDKLVKVDLPYNGLVPEKHIPGQTVEVFFLDLFVPKDAEVRRMKVEPQMWIPDRWITYPMEVRIATRQLLTQTPARGGIAPVDSPADSTYRDVFSAVFCDSRENNAPGPPLSIRSLLLRNARQDAALALPLGSLFAGPLLGYGNNPDWCKNPLPRAASPAGPEPILRLRDRLLREAP
jgi:hypothetical protein